MLCSLARSAIRPLAAQVGTVRDATAAFLGGPLAARASALGFAESELPGLARAYALHRAAMGCTEEQAFAAVTTPGNPAFRLVRAGGRFLDSVDNYRSGLRLSAAYDGWYAKVAADLQAGRKNTPTLLNGAHTAVKPQSGAGFAKFLFDEIALNADIDLASENPEDVFGAANNPAMRHLCRHFGGSCYNTLAAVPPATRHLMYRLMDVLCPLGESEQEAAAFAWGSTDSPIFVARALRHRERAEALFADGRTPTRDQVLDLLFPDVPAEKRGTNHALNRHFSDFVYDQFKQKVITQGGMVAINGLLTNTGCTLDEALDAHLTGKTIPYAPYVTEANDYIEGVVSSAAGLAQLKRDLVRPQRPNLVASGQPAISPENNRFRFNFPDGTTLVAKHGQETNPEVAASHAAIADKIAQLVGAVHPEQLGAVYSAATQAATGPLLSAAPGLGLSVNEHVALTFTLAKDAQTGAVTITYSEPVGCPVKFHWTTTIAIDGSTVTTPLVVEEAAAQ